MNAGRARSSRISLAALSIGLALALVAVAAAARPGGGHAFSGGSRSSGGGYGGGGGGDGGVLIQLLLWLILEHPAIGVPLLLGVGVVFLIKSAASASMKGWNTTAEQVQAVERVEQRALVPRVELDRIRSIDPEFSVVLFEDFAYLLYAAVQRARAAGTQPIAAYLSPDLAQSLTDPNLGDVRGIIIGAMSVVGFSGVQGTAISVELELETNYVEVARTGGERRFYAVDRMVLQRASTARSRPFERARTLNCPNCGAPFEALRGTECSYCRQNVGYGRFDWMVARLTGLSREPRGPLLTSDVREEGTDRPTLIDPGTGERLQALQQRDPAFTWEVLQGRIAHVFGELGAAWSARDPKRIRPYVSDSLFQSMLYWIDLYVQQRCRNVTENARVLRMDLANVLSDAHYDAVTVRVFAQSLDYTISDEGRLLSGSRSRPRTYSEYWTLIRGSSRKGPSRGNVNCPNCGAPLQVGMAGNCEYCQVKVTAGEFDWVLSRIEQDEAYAG